MDFSNICIVLVEPLGALNIGSVCRVMMNFGFSDLRLVNPQVDHKNNDARNMALKAGVFLDNAEIFSGLGEALEDCKFSFGTTRRFGKYREELLHPPEAAELFFTLPANTRTALVFGREDKGLFTKELDLCQCFVTIPASEDFPSMNLAQAAAICLYEFSKLSCSKKYLNRKNKIPASGKNIENMFQHMKKTLLDIDYLDAQNPDHLLRTFRRIFGRSILDAREVRILQGLWSRIDWIENQRKINKG